MSKRIPAPVKPSKATKPPTKPPVTSKLGGIARQSTPSEMDAFRAEVEAAHAAPFVIGKAYLVRTGTMLVTGRVVQVVGQLLVLEDAAWIADTGRFSTALKTGELSEVEPADGLVFVGIGAIVDVYEWNHKLPREVK